MHAGRNVYEKLRDALRTVIRCHKLAGREVSVTCRPLSATEAIGTPEHPDYPIIKGREVMVEAVFEGAAGQAFTDEFENASYRVEDLPEIDLDSNSKRASFISGLNAVFRYLEQCEKTIHCKNAEPQECADHLLARLPSWKKVLLIGLQPRFLECLASQREVRVIDLDPENVGREKFGIPVESSETTARAIAWCDGIFATGSTLVNATMTAFAEAGKPVIFYGVTIAAAANILELQRYCHSGH